MEVVKRIKSAGRILLRGEDKTGPRAEIPPLTAEQVAEMKQFFPMEKFFIYGHARSGTTLLARLIRLHPEVHCNWQAHFFTRKPLLKSLVDSAEMEEWLTRRSNRWNDGTDLSPLVMRAAADYIMESDAKRAGAEKHIVGDKSPNSLNDGESVRLMHAVYPDAYLINIVRDGRDVLISQRFRNFVEESKFLTKEDKQIVDALRADQTPFTTGERSIFTEKWLRANAEGWVKNLIETADAGKRLFGERYYEFRYEDLLYTPLTVMKKVWALFDISIDDALDEAIQAEMSSNPDQTWQKERNKSIADFLPKGKAGNWQNIFTVRDREIFNEVVGEMLVKWKYEL
ncbi:MAG: sulfotransferase [Anaerolineales bacterium]|uniref:Sulfotransferase n=1 Tax=Candidatus Desulfolinea nitratireducens TaxID=2841698 RepID=A0A8J6NMM7_9CHLR|nr:sulfotransferase [Candidatus Desulfolinea nitratireducens]MBL6959536.1 sulfotransferase [Anaerolineales bacterium]